ncbi:OmpA family protein [candidate division KSB1 bacterium]|nr:OmpA family protein [candidate division KSB1 bacterium]
MKFWHKILLLALLPLRIYPQTGLNSNAAHLSDPRTIFANPAILSFQSSKWLGVVGYQRFFTGLDVNLNNSLLGAAFSTEKWGAFGITGKIFNSPILKKNDFQLLYSYQIWQNKFSVGMNAGIIGVGLEPANFQLLQPGDPVLTSKNSISKLNLGAGILYQPFPHLFAGLAANHLNRPTLAYGDAGDEESPYLNASLIYDHRLFKPMLSLEREQGRTYFNMGVETWLFHEQTMLRGCYANEDLSFGLAYCFKNFRLDYEYCYPLNELNQISNGTHQFLISYASRFSRKDREVVPDFEIEVYPVKPESPAEQGIFPGQEASFKIKIIPQNGFNAPVLLSIENLPHHFTAELSNKRIFPTDSAQVQFKANFEGPAGIFLADIIGESGNLADVKKIRIKVNPLPEIYAKISCQPEVLKIIKIQQVHEENPLLNYIFFPENADQLDPNRYELLNDLKIPHGFVFFADSVSGIQDQYKNILNLIASRLVEWPESKINLVGCNTNFGVEKENLTLSRQRATAVKNYLTQNCGIDSQRIRISFRNLPEDSSSIQIEEGRAENRRVEIHVERDSEKILEPFTTTSSRIITSDSVCTIMTTGTRVGAKVKNWKIEIRDHTGAVVNQFNGNVLPAKIEWDWKNLSGEPISPNQIYDISLTVEDILSQVAQSDRATFRTVYEVIQQQTAPQKVEKTRLFLFKFNADQIDVSSLRLKKKLDHLAQRISEIPGAKIVLKGYTDIIGIDDYNLQLSSRRATTIRNELIRRGIAESQIEALGYGRQNPLMDNSLPEGRMMNRRVEVFIEIP